MGRKDVLPVKRKAHSWRTVRKVLRIGTLTWSERGHSMACRECVHLHIVGGRIIYARCLLGHALFERYGEGRLDVATHTCPEEHSAAHVVQNQIDRRLGKEMGEK